PARDALARDDRALLARTPVAVLAHLGLGRDAQHPTVRAILLALGHLALGPAHFAHGGLGRQRLDDDEVAHVELELADPVVVRQRGGAKPHTNEKVVHGLHPQAARRARRLSTISSVRRGFTLRNSASRAWRQRSTVARISSTDQCSASPARSAAPAPSRALGASDFTSKRSRQRSQ